MAFEQNWNGIVLQGLFVEFKKKYCGWHIIVQHVSVQYIYLG